MSLFLQNTLSLDSPSTAGSSGAGSAQAGGGVGQGHMHHEAPLIIIILNVVLLPFGDDILYKDDFKRSFYSHFHHQQ